MRMSTRARKNSLPPKSCATISKIDQNFVPPFVPLFVLCDCHKRMTSISYMLRKFLQKSHKLNAKLNNNLEVIIKGLFQSKSTFLPKVSKSNFYRQKWIANGSKELLCSGKNNSWWAWYKRKYHATKFGKQILRSLPKDGSKHFLKKCCIA